MPIIEDGEHDRMVKFKLRALFCERWGKGMPLLPRSSVNKALVAIFAIWFILMNLQALGITATSLEPWIGGVPLSLFFMWAITALATLAGIAAYAIWGKEFERNVEKVLKEGE